MEATIFNPSESYIRCAWRMNTLTENLRSACVALSRTVLDDMDGVKLMKRFDAKYVIPESWLPELVNAVAGSSRILEVNGQTETQYENLYYELPGEKFLKDHLRGKARRMKVRERRYDSNNMTFLEVKRRFAGGKTIKDRVNRHGRFRESWTSAEQDFLKSSMSTDTVLEPRLYGSFMRMTLVNFERGERMTLDRNLECTLVGSAPTALLKGLAIIEIKQPKPDRYGPAQRWLRSQDKRQGVVARKTRISKYAMSRLECDPDIAARTYLATYRRLQDAKSWAEDLQA